MRNGRNSTRYQFDFRRNLPCDIQNHVCYIITIIAVAAPNFDVDPDERCIDERFNTNLWISFPPEAVYKALFRGDVDSP
ncbi:hypothetical protein E4T56_gene10266 [Termitomyces sp. T112]|nr:hypothetical protein E4T56_gene10266 [Termitomyces sp. T112]